VRSFASRIPRLEDRRRQSPGSASEYDQALEDYFYFLEVDERIREGAEPPPYGERERRLDESTISYIVPTVPTLRASLGWSPSESQATLDQWEWEARVRLAKYNGRNLQRGV
jgi:hypothetical protein